MCKADTYTDMYVLIQVQLWCCVGFMYRLLVDKTYIDPDCFIGWLLVNGLWPPIWIQTQQAGQTNGYICVESDMWCRGVNCTQGRENQWGGVGIVCLRGWGVEGECLHADISIGLATIWHNINVLVILLYIKWFLDVHCHLKLAKIDVIVKLPAFM